MDTNQKFISILRHVARESGLSIFIYRDYAKSDQHRSDIRWVSDNLDSLSPEYKLAAEEFVACAAGDLQQYHRNLKNWANKHKSLGPEKSSVSEAISQPRTVPIDRIEEDLPVLSPEQQRLMQKILASTKPVFVTGKAGTGKSLVLKHLVRTLPGDEPHVVAAFTGMAARNVHGVTLHSFVLDNYFEVSLPIASEFRTFSKQKLELLAKLKWLVIDEVSMVRGDFIDRIDRALRLAKSSNVPFGGCRIVMFGDLLQLPPFVDLPRYENEAVKKWKKWLSSYPKDEPEFFMAHVFSVSGLETFELEEVFRQTDRDFIECLNRIRIADPIESDIELINSRSVPFQRGESITRLMGRRREVEAHNTAKLGEIKHERLWNFRYTVDPQSPNQEPTESYLSKELPCPLEFKVKVGARVMFVKNDILRRWVNGTIGTVTDISDDQIDVEVGDQTFSVEKVAWVIGTPYFDSSAEEIKLKTGVVIHQFPLTLAWAVTVHKAQGQTLDEVICDFSMSYFAESQAYVALSRVTSLTGLSVIGHFSKQEHVMSISTEVINFLEHASEQQIQEPLAFPISKDVLNNLVNAQFQSGGLIEDWMYFDHRARIEYLNDQFSYSVWEYCEYLQNHDAITALSIYWNVIGRQLGNSRIVCGANSRSEIREFLAESPLILGDDESLVLEHIAAKNKHNE